jgi:hypothetical protein
MSHLQPKYQGAKFHAIWTKKEIMKIFTFKKTTNVGTWQGWWIDVQGFFADEQQYGCMVSFCMSVESLLHNKDLSNAFLWPSD